MGLFFLGFGSKGLIEKVLKLEGCGVGRCEVRRCEVERCGVGRCEVRRLCSQIASSYLSVTSVSRVRKSKHLLFTFLERDVTTPNEPSVARLGFCRTSVSDNMQKENERGIRGGDI